MKAVTVAIILLALSLGAVVANSIILNSIIDDISDEIEDTDDEKTASALLQYEEIYEKYKSRASYIGLTTNHEDLTSIEQSFSEIIGAAKADDSDTIMAIKSRLIDELRHLKRLSGINIDSIF